MKQNLIDTIMKKSITYLIAIAALMVISVGAMAQDGGTPYAGSTHTYSITPDANSTGKTYLWTLSGGGTIDGSATGSSVVIDWGTTAGTYTLTFTETDGNTSCLSVRDLEVEVIANSFYLNMEANASECHDSTGQVLADGATGPTTLYFTVSMNKDAAWTIDSWEFDFTVAVAGTDYTLTSVKVDGGADLGTSGTYVDQSIVGTNDEIEIAVEITGAVTAGTDVTVQISNGEAIVGTAVTPDNGTGPDTQILTVNPLPDTSDITTD